MELQNAYVSVRAATQTMSGLIHSGDVLDVAPLNVLYLRVIGTLRGLTRSSVSRLKKND
jgi:hypothetical protein